VGGGIGRGAIDGSGNLRAEQREEKAAKPKPMNKRGDELKPRNLRNTFSPRENTTKVREVV